MDNVTYRKNVYKTLSVKPAKAGLRFVVRNTIRVNLFHASTGLASEAMELVNAMSDYLIGASQLTDKMKVHAFEEMGDFGYYLVVASKSVKAKLPGSGKKLKLKGMTRSAAVLDLHKAASDILDLAKKNFYGPKMIQTTKVAPVKHYGDDGKVTGITDEQVTVETVDLQATQAMYDERMEKIKQIIEERIVPLYWSLCYDLFEVPPANLFVGNIAKLSKRYGEGFFQLSEAEDRDTEEEITAMSEATT